MRLSLRWRIILSYAALLVIAMGGLSWFLSSSVRETYLDQYRSSLMAEARILAIQLQPILQEGSPYPGLDDFVAQNASLLETRITIILPDGKVIGESSQSPEQLGDHLNRPEVQQALNGNVGDEIRYSDTLGTQMLYIAVPVQTGGETLGILRLAISLAQLQANTNFILQGFLGATLLAILATVLLAGVLTNYITRPLQQLIDSVRLMSDGHLKEIELSDRSDEIGQLELEFNQLAAQLNMQIEELKSEQGKLSAVLAHMTDGVLIVDEAGIVQLINPAAEQLFSLTTEEALGHSLAEVARQHQLFNLWRQCQNTAVQQSTTMELSPDRLFIQAVATPLPKAVPGGTLLVLQNFTRLRRLEIVRRDFVSNVSHELRTPLASLKALTDTLMEGALEDPPAARRFLLRMEHEIDNLTQLVQELLELSRIESRQVPLERRAITPCELLAPTVERMQLQAERAGLALRLDCPPDLPAVLVDPERMQQVLINLIHNAIKFTLPGGEVVASAYAEGSRVVFSIKDTGVGIDPEALPRIFERFYKADRARSGGGTGLGLSIARHLVEAHNGQIWAESTPGQGSTFYFYLPKAR